VAVAQFILIRAITPEDAQRAIENLRIEVPRISMRPMPRITLFSHFLSGEAAFKALRKEVEALVKLAPPDHDVLIEAFGILVRDARCIKPHTLLFAALAEQVTRRLSLSISHSSSRISFTCPRKDQKGSSRVSPRKKTNQALELTASRSMSTFSTTISFSAHLTLAFGGRSSACFP
jgi:hypothetical protein